VARRPGLDVFAFLDYRAFLRAYYQLKQKQHLSYRAFSRRAKLSSPNYLKLVIDGQRNLSVEMAERFATACDLSGEAARYFRELVAFNQATELEQRNACYKRLLGFRRYREMQRLDVAQDTYHSKWYLPAIRELAARPDFRDDPDWIAALLEPPIRPAEAKQALEVLLELGMLIRSSDGRLHQSQSLVTTGAETTSQHVASYHATMMAQAERAMNELPAEERDISSLTLCLSAGGLSQVKEAVVRFRRELLQLSELESRPSQVIQLNFQLFPLTRRDDDDSRSK
jgi:uncharacterized protein (TIGR02147 family)